MRSSLRSIAAFPASRARHPGFRARAHPVHDSVRPRPAREQEDARVDSHDHIIETGKGNFGLDALGPLLPGMAEIMPLIGERIWKCFYAGKAHNQPLARFQLKEAVNLMEKGVFLRPKYAENMEKFIDGEVASVRKAIDDADWTAFESAFHEMVGAANAYHEVYDKGYLRWKIPDAPPPDLDFTPR
jgi:hypothetical protein